jgi:hypothetical protein
MQELRCGALTVEFPEFRYRSVIDRFDVNMAYKNQKCLEDIE